MVSTKRGLARMSFSKKSRGFTLIELLVVVAIIGLLSSIVFASLGSTRKNARVNSVKISLRNIATSMALCIDEGFTAVIPTTEAATAGVTNVCSNQTTVKTTYGTLPGDWTYCDGNAAGGCTVASSATAPQVAARSTNDAKTITCTDSICTES